MSKENDEKQKNFKQIIEELSKEKNLDQEVIIESMRQAIITAYKKNYEGNTNCEVDIDLENNKINLYKVYKIVPDDKEDINKNEEITLTEARKKDKNALLDGEIKEAINSKDFGRIAATTAKQVVTQRIKQAERDTMLKEFGNKEHEILVGKVEMEDANNYYINFGRTNGVLAKTECIPGEEIKIGKTIKVYVSKVNNDGKNLYIKLSRCHFGFVKALFEKEIPEIMDGTVLVYGVARVPGIRTKISVYSDRINVDPVGACIGEKGSRIKNIIDELNGEKIDVVKYDSDPEAFIANSLLPALNLHIIITDSEKQEALVVADSENFPLAIGRNGQNVKLASRLTKYHLDIKTSDEASKLGINFK